MTCYSAATKNSSEVGTGVAVDLLNVDTTIPHGLDAVAAGGALGIGEGPVRGKFHRVQRMTHKKIRPKAALYSFDDVMRRPSTPPSTCVDTP